MHELGRRIYICEWGEALDFATTYVRIKAEMRQDEIWGIAVILREIS